MLKAKGAAGDEAKWSRNNGIMEEKRAGGKARGPRRIEQENVPARERRDDESSKRCACMP